MTNISEQTNIWREDEVKADQMLSQEEALICLAAQETFDGYMVVDLIVEK